MKVSIGELAWISLCRPPVAVIEGEIDVHDAAGGALVNSKKSDGKQHAT
jgi:hypothetical protein